MDDLIVTKEIFNKIEEGDNKLYDVKCLTDPHRGLRRQVITNWKRVISHFVLLRTVVALSFLGCGRIISMLLFFTGVSCFGGVAFSVPFAPFS